MSEEDAILPTVQTTMALDAKVYATRWLFLHDPDISIWYDDISCKIRPEFAGDPNCFNLVGRN